jgi:4-amino-4-deoxy-L-arabinose transferase-like glycosyltransferase
LTQAETPATLTQPEPTPPRPQARRRIPTSAWICALAAFLVATCWSLIVPLFQVPDEPGHIGYAQYVAEAGKPPSGSGNLHPFSQEERRLLNALRWKLVIRRPENRPPATASTQENLDRLEDAPGDRLGEGGYTTITNNPPLYYAVAGGAYRLSPSTSLADRIHVMRLVSALLAAITVLLTFLFLRELLPAAPWAWTVGALAVAFQPMFGFISGGVNSDDLLYTASAGVFLGLAASFRRGLTPGWGLWIGACAAVGVLAKINMVGLLPGILVGLIFLVRGADRTARRDAVRGALAAAAVVAGAVLVYVALNSTVWDRGLFFGASGQSFGGGAGSRGLPDVTDEPLGSIAGALNYAWQFYLPRLPFMDPQFVYYPLREIWFKGFIGSFGWLEFGFASWVYDLALGIMLAVGALAGRELLVNRNKIRERLPELAVYAILMVGLLILVNGNGYVARIDGEGGFEQARYLFPLLPLYAAVVALAARAAGRRYGPALGVLLISVAIAHTAVAMLLALTRYYG